MSQGIKSRRITNGVFTILFNLKVLGRSNPTNLNVSRNNLAATSNTKYALFGGGLSYSSNVYSTVDAYDSNLTKRFLNLSSSISSLAATSIGYYAIFCGGGNNSSFSNVVDAFDANLTRTTPTVLNIARNSLAATSIGNYALFGGGYTGSSPSNVVDAYTNHYKIQVYPGTKYSFNGSSEAESNTLQTLNYTGALAGYLKVKNASVN